MKTQKPKSKSQSRREAVQKSPLSLNDLISRVKKYLDNGPKGMEALFPRDIEITGVSVHYRHGEGKNKHGTTTFTK